MHIDLAWHSHQLMARKYSGDCFRTVGRFVDHDDKVEENFLAMSLDITCRAWEQRFRVPYMHCGCPLPGDTVGQRLGHLSRILKGNTTHEDINPPHRNDAFRATHPSEHPAIQGGRRGVLPDHARSRREVREAKMRERRARDAEKVRRGKMDVALFRRGEGHDYPFLTPVPFTMPVAACIAVGSQLTCGSGSCAVGAGMCGSTGDATCGSGSCSGVACASFSGAAPCAAATRGAAFAGMPMVSMMSSGGDGSGSPAPSSSSDSSISASGGGVTEGDGGGPSSAAICLGGSTSVAACGAASSSAAACGGGSASACGGVGSWSDDI